MVYLKDCEYTWVATTNPSSKSKSHYATNRPDAWLALCGVRLALAQPVSPDVVPSCGRCAWMLQRDDP